MAASTGLYRGCSLLCFASPSDCFQFFPPDFNQENVMNCQFYPISSFVFYWLFMDFIFPNSHSSTSSLVMGQLNIHQLRYIIVRHFAIVICLFSAGTSAFHGSSLSLPGPEWTHNLYQASRQKINSFDEPSQALQRSQCEICLYL